MLLARRSHLVPVDKGELQLNTTGWEHWAERPGAASLVSNRTGKEPEALSRSAHCPRLVVFSCRLS